MSLRVRVLVMLALFTLALSLSLAACGGDPPAKEIQQANAAVAAAQLAGAERYAAEEFAAARVALEHAHEAVAQHDYRLALNHALDSRERADTSAAAASTSMAAAKTAADQAISGAVAAIGTAAGLIKTQEASRLVPAKLLAGSRAALTLAETGLQEARTAWEKGEFALATTKAKGATEEVNQAVASLQARPAPPGRRRR